MSEVKCPNCGYKLTGNGKNCIDCNTKDGHKLIRDTRRDIFNKDFKEKYRGQCHSVAGYVIVPGAILCWLILWIIGTYFNPVLLDFVPHSFLSSLAMAFPGFIFYIPVYFIKKHSLYKKFIESQFEGDSK